MTAAWLLLAPQAALSATVRGTPPPVAVQVTLTQAARPIPASFLGVSIETRELLDYVRDGVAFDRVLSLLHGSRAGAMLVRVAGKSADDAFWKTPASGMPSWVFEIGDDWLANLAALARRDRLRVSLALNVAVHSPAMEAEYARAALTALGRSGLGGLSIGNEPDLFVFQPGLERERVGNTTAPPFGWTRDYSPASYRRDYMAYARALFGAAPGVPLSGPEVTGPHPDWLHALTGLGRLGPNAITLHRYPLSMCWAKDAPHSPRISSLLGADSSAGLARPLRDAVTRAHRAGMSFRVSEMGSISCGGNRRVAQSFATALWAPDALFELVRAGVDGVNWHLRAGMPNSPFELKAHGIAPMPELYGLVLFARMMATDARLIDTRTTPAVARLKVWAVRSGINATVLVINKSPRTAEVSIRAGTFGSSAHVERLRAPAITSQAHVTLADRSIGPDGRWRGRAATTLIRPRDGAYRFRVPGFSAALVSHSR